MLRPHRIQAFPQQDGLGARQSGKDLVRTGQIELGLGNNSSALRKRESLITCSS